MSIYGCYQPKMVDSCKELIEVEIARDKILDLVEMAPGSKAIVKRSIREGYVWQLCITQHSSWGQR